MMLRPVIVLLLALPAALGGTPWDKAPEKWSIADVYRILEDSPWSPADVKLEVKGAGRQENSQTGMVTNDSPMDSNTSNTVPGVQLSQGTKPRSGVPVLWWSSKTVRLAEQRLLQSRDSAAASQPLHAEELPDYVLVVEGSEPLRILQDAKDDLHDTVFLELPNGVSLDFESVRFAERSANVEPHVEFHFPRQVDGQPTIDPDAERVIFHCKAMAKTAHPYENNTLSLRAEFKPKNMRVRGTPDL